MSTTRLCTVLGLGAIAVSALSCSGDVPSGPNPPGTPGNITVLSGDHQVGEVGVPLSLPIAVKLTDRAGNPLRGRKVTFTITSGGGSLSVASAMTDPEGVATATWIMGYVVDVEPQLVTARVTGVDGPSVTFSAVASFTAGTVSVVTGNDQVGQVSTPLPTQPSVRVTTSGPAGSPVRGVPVRWTVASGGGTADTVTTTNAAGIATSRWTLGNIPGMQSQVLRATVAGLGADTAEFVASAVTPTATIVKIAGDSQTGTVAQPLGQPLVVEVLNTVGLPQAGVVVNWLALDACNGWCYHDVKGTLSSATSVTDSLGRASVDFVLPWLAGHAWVVQASVDGVVSPVAFQADIVPGLPAALVSYYGNHQSAPAGTQLALVIEVAVSDEFANGIPGVTVQWAAAPGSGSTEVASSVTNSTGQASTHWTIGTTLGTNNQTATATVPGLSGSPVTFTASATAGP